MWQRRIYHILLNIQPRVDDYGFLPLAILGSLSGVKDKDEP